MESGWAVLEMRLQSTRWAYGQRKEEAGDKYMAKGSGTRERVEEEGASTRSERQKGKIMGESSIMVGERNVAANTEARQRAGEMISRVEK